MPRPLTKKQLRKVRYVLLAVAVALLAPIGVYISTFGISISNSHTRWSEMGSAMAGIYAPILAILTLCVLLVQVQLQGQLNEHTFDQGYIQDVRADLHFYLEQLAYEFRMEFSDGQDVVSILVSNFAYVSFSDLQQPQTVEIGKVLNR